MKIIKKLVSAENFGTFTELETDAVRMRVMFYEDSIVRIRTAFDGSFADDSTSYVLMPHEKNAAYIFKESEDRVVLAGSALSVEIMKEPFRIRILDADGSLLHEDVKTAAYMRDSNNRRIHRFMLREQEHYYGFGEKAGALDKQQERLVMAPSDAYGYDAEKSDSLYKHIPFFIRLDARTRKACGYYYNCTAVCEFNMGREISNYYGDCFGSFRADAGEIDLFFIAGPAIRTVTERYTDITGKSALLPEKALGYLGSSMYYSELEEDCGEAITHFADTAEKEKMPMTGYMLSSGYTTAETADGSRRCVFTWNSRRFPDPEKFFAEMKRRGIPVAPNVKPGVLRVHPYFHEFAEKGMFILDSEKDEPAIGAWWGGPGAFVDFTSEKARNCWKEYLKEALIRKGADAVWNDNCEFDGVTDRDARVSLEGKGGTIGQIAAVMPNLMCRIAGEALLEENENRRPFVVCRSGHSGIQRYAQVWAGDNYTSWKTLKFNIATILGMGLSGVANQGCDIGGFGGPSPEAELLVRWVQNGIFQPRFSVHSSNSDNTVTEPWMYQSTAPLIREAMHMRMRLMPYLYSLMYRASVTGLPIMEAMCSAFQNDPACDEESVDFMLGDSILAACVVEKGAAERKVYLPEGQAFYDFCTHERYAGGQTVTLPVTLASVPMFLKEGAILPLEDRLILVPGNSSFTLYEDDGETMDYLKGAYLRTEIRMEKKNGIKVSFSEEGSYEPACRSLMVELLSDRKAPLAVQVCGRELRRFLYQPEFAEAAEGYYYCPDTASVLIRCIKEKGHTQLNVSFEAKDLIGM